MNNKRSDYCTSLFFFVQSLIKEKKVILKAPATQIQCKEKFRTYITGHV